ncbi:MAG TPA: MEDS domain-containing protein [Pseudonocardiaceae bacterium]|nr:MEDS domain-containing protein [Pseudonocardiaceae bacterium]
MTETARGFGPHDHLCWVYDEPGEFHSRAMEFLADGLAQGQRVWYTADTDPGALWEELRYLDKGRRRGSVRVGPPGARDAAAPAVDPVGQVRALAAVMQETLAAGFTGLRIVTEATPQLRTPEHLNAWACCELLADRYMMALPFSAMCGYNRAELSKEAIAHVACLHPTVNAGAPFRLYSSSGAAVSLSGELDLTSCDLFATALRRADLRPVDNELIIDATGLDFIDHRNLLILAAHARSCGATAVLRTGFTNSAARMVEILDIEDVRVEVSG